MLQAARPASVVIPARDEAATVGPIVEACAALPDVAEVIVVDDGSADATATIARAAGATVVAATAGPGKGAALRDGVANARAEIVVFCDADLEDFDGSFVTKLVDAVRTPGRRLVKGRYTRAGAGGRVTELTAKPAIRLLHPSLAHVDQPLGGEYAAPRDTLVELRFVRGYGVDLAMLIDVAARYGPETIGQVDLGVRHHRNRPLRELGAEAEEVLAVALQRAGVPGVTVEECLPLRARRRSA